MLSRWHERVRVRARPLGKSTFLVCAGLAIVFASGACSANHEAPKRGGATAPSKAMREVRIWVEEHNKIAASASLSLASEELLQRSAFFALGIFKDGKLVGSLELRPGNNTVPVPEGETEFRSSLFLLPKAGGSSARSVFVSRAAVVANVQNDGQEVALTFESFQAAPLKTLYGLVYADDKTPARDVEIEVLDAWTEFPLRLPNGESLARTDARGVYAFTHLVPARGGRRQESEVLVRIGKGQGNKVLRTGFPALPDGNAGVLPFVNLTGANQRSPFALNLDFLRGPSGAPGQKGSDGWSVGVSQRSLSSGPTCPHGGLEISTWRQPPGAMPSQFDAASGSVDLKVSALCNGGGGGSPGPGVPPEGGHSLVQISSGATFGNIGSSFEDGQGNVVADVWTNDGASARFKETQVPGRFEWMPSPVLFSVANCSGAGHFDAYHNGIGMRAAADFVRQDAAAPAALVGIFSRYTASGCVDARQASEWRIGQLPNVLVRVESRWYRSTDGYTHSGVSFPAGVTPVSIWFAGNGRFFLRESGEGAPSYRSSTDGGVTWSAPFNVSGLSNTWFQDASRWQWAEVGSQGTLYVSDSSGLFRSTDLGRTWAAVALPSGVAPEGIRVRSNGTLVGDYGQKISTNGGVTFSNAPGRSRLWSVTPVQGSASLRLAFGGTSVNVSTDSGLTWVEKTIPSGVDSTTSAAFAEGSTLVALQNSGFYRSADLGNTWSYVPMSSIAGVALSGSNLAVLVGNAMQVSTNGGSSWTAGDSEVYGLTSLNGTWVRVLLRYQPSWTWTFQKSSDGGVTWADFGMPLDYPDGAGSISTLQAKPCGALRVCFANGRSLYSISNLNSTPIVERYHSLSGVNIDPWRVLAGLGGLVFQESGVWKHWGLSAASPTALPALPASPSGSAWYPEGVNAQGEVVFRSQSFFATLSGMPGAWTVEEQFSPHGTFTVFEVGATHFVGLPWGSPPAVVESTDGGWTWTKHGFAGLPPASQVQQQSLVCQSASLCTLVVESGGLKSIWKSTDRRNWVRLYDVPEGMNQDSPIMHFLGSSLLAYSDGILNMNTGSFQQPLFPRFAWVKPAVPFVFPQGITAPLGEFEKRENP